jgi:hypothetical protein
MLKAAFFLGIAHRSPYMNQRFGGAYHFHLPTTKRRLT